MCAEGKDVINLGIGSPDMPPPAEATTGLIQEAQKKGVNGYQPYQGIPELRSGIAEFYQRHYQTLLNPITEILPLLGSKEGIMHTSLAYLNPGDEVLIPHLGYPTYTSVSRIAGASIKHYPLLEKSNWEPDWAFIEAAIHPTTKLIWLNYPHMPTGTVGSLDILEKFVKIAQKHNVLLCHDNPYSQVRNERPMSIFQVRGAREVAIEFNSMSKTFNMAGWRIGWVCGAEHFLQPILKIKSNMDSGMFRPVQAAAIEALKLGKDWFESQNQHYRNREKQVIEFLTLLGCTFHKGQAGLFMWAKVPRGTGEEMCDRLLQQHHIFVTPGHIFGEPGRNYIRVSLCQEESIIKTAIDRLK